MSSKILSNILIIFITLLLISCSSEEISFNECDFNQDGKVISIELKMCDNNIFEDQDKNEEESEQNLIQIDDNGNDDNKIVIIKEEINSEIVYEELNSTVKTVNGVSINEINYLITNPSTGNKLEAILFEPDMEIRSGVLMIQGGTGDFDSFLRPAYPRASHSSVEEIASNGFMLLIFNPDGRGNSEGEEDYNGFLHQDGFYEMYRFLNEKVNDVGVISYSYGVAMASGMLGRYQPNTKFYIEWEGPTNREHVSVGCRDDVMSVKEGMNCDDDLYWAEREALNFVPYFNTDYFVILQSSEDHVQRTYDHSVNMNNLAVENLDWVRVNGPENDINQIYTSDDFPTYDDDKERDTKIIEYIIEFTN